MSAAEEVAGDACSSGLSPVTQGASGAQNVTTQHFSFSTRRECKHARTDAYTHTKHTDTHTRSGT